ncbi:MAG: hypothetical protein A2Z12_03045 [Actinobacteria bacterium RBG_16_68_21]|nr:MAG: hypothetical protein A2Z12_03045 [Actinobacteria bacterium RBG_16_68_21]
MLMPLLHRRRLAAFAVMLGITALVVPGAGAEEPYQLLGVGSLDRLVRLAPGVAGPDVTRLQEALTSAGFYRSEATGAFDVPTETAVLAFHKYLGLPRTTTFNALDWIRLDSLPSDPGIPDRWYEPDRVEIDVTRQLMFVVREGEVTGILPVSTAGDYTYHSVRSGQTVSARTPHGDFHLMWRQWGWNCDPVTTWCVYNYWAFTPFYGIHGYREVPSYPASHGCTRVNLWDSDWLDSELFVGMPVHVWDEPPTIAPPHQPAHLTD